MATATRLVLCATSVLLMLASISVPQVRPRDEAQPRQSRVNLEPAEADGRVIYRIAPEYPDIARRGHIEGPVTLRIIVGSDGTVQKLTPIRGNPFLLMSAMNAVKQWRYRPYLLNGAHVEFESSVTLKFTL